MQIGSPLPNTSDLIFKQILEGNIEILDTVQELHERSQINMRNVESLGLVALNGSWCYTPKYLHENKHAISYMLGHVLLGPTLNYTTLLTEMTQRVENEMYYGPLRQLRTFLINHDTVSGKTDLRMPDEWTIDFDESLTVADFMGVVEAYVREPQRQAISSFVYEHFYANGLNDKNGAARFAFIGGQMVFVAPDSFAPGVNYKYNMTRIIRFISRPWNHGLDQKNLRAYRSLVNL
ncbi:hypothetical protein MPK67_gp072 [Erwinia phage pEa_SNUABM_32]|uniref:Uncharacterized protein n=2 Tax=Alexandravirus TaxID=2733088 RepID=A0AAE7XJR7_9CAUD|nr:hypothetical protein MPK67_gp072 [Erwinia phage pEa_SNUABM_32]YP_010301185.1 hypothetical protein MPK68_gp072 [Erwinia phage pEa_SNUABM_3]QZE56608.1 hypothetical protein pEaSNUABM20_00072 [Erwinia phage pEa_SNUABM_20]QZE58288.1 hypothetical protein pEaSNUABM40_00072 [Erwinia phage pEa_SNUABM_40]UAW52853.1 hypothetical protein pEaSNUABM23_00071 [Erwinia phage pEa_SNUABM_23]UIW10749.1 hypothetical protein pEaSNUABM23_00071 [Erwinia phage pEa_SNUABM_31]QZE56269.1 hypothetical protein pEaSNUAB